MWNIHKALLLQWQQLKTKMLQRSQEIALKNYTKRQTVYWLKYTLRCHPDIHWCYRSRDTPVQCHTTRINYHNITWTFQYALRCQIQITCIREARSSCRSRELSKNTTLRNALIALWTRAMCLNFKVDRLIKEQQNVRYYNSSCNSS